MYSMTVESEGVVYLVHHEGDYSGDVLICMSGDREVRLPFEVLKAVVAEYVRSHETSLLEQASVDDLLHHEW